MQKLSFLHFYNLMLSFSYTFFLPSCLNIRVFSFDKMSADICRTCYNFYAFLGIPNIQLAVPFSRNVFPEHKIVWIFIFFFFWWLRTKMYNTNSKPGLICFKKQNLQHSPLNIQGESLMSYLAHYRFGLPPILYELSLHLLKSSPG